MRRNKLLLHLAIIFVCASFVSYISVTHSYVGKQLASNASAASTDVPNVFIYYDWQLGGSGGYDALESTYNIEKLGANDSLTYVSGTFQFTNFSQGGYGGLQTHVATLPGSPRGVIFSVWGITSATEAPGAVKTINTVNCDGVAGSTCVQLALAYNWQVNKAYKWGYQILGSNPANANEYELNAYIEDAATGAQRSLGSVFYPKTHGKIYGLNTFLEVFPPVGSSDNSCSNRVEVILSAQNTNANHGAVTSHGRPQDPTPPAACPSTYWYQNLASGYRIGHNSPLPAGVTPITLASLNATPNPAPAPTPTPTPTPGASPTPGKTPNPSPSKSPGPAPSPGTTIPSKNTAQPNSVTGSSPGASTTSSSYNGSPVSTATSRQQTAASIAAAASSQGAQTKPFYKNSKALISIGGFSLVLFLLSFVGYRRSRGL